VAAQMMIDLPMRSKVLYQLFISASNTMPSKAHRREQTHHALSIQRQSWKRGQSQSNFERGETTISNGVTTLESPAKRNCSSSSGKKTKSTPSQTWMNYQTKKNT
jgi:hypothetical protein